MTTNCIDAATLGGFGPGFTYTGHDDVFLGVPDRGPFDGRTDVPYPARFHFFHMTVDTSAPFPNITTTLLDTRFLTGTGNTSFIGDAYAFATDEASETRFDPEGARVDRDGNVYVSDEYGPYIRKFNQQGQLLARIAVPPKFLLDPVTGHKSGDINNPADAASLELTPANNVTGRQANRGMEGLAITPGGTMLVGIMQNALIQDNGLADVTDVSSVPVLPEKGTDLAGLGITPVKKTLFLDLLKDVYKVNATQTIKDVIAEKIEALAWGPDLPDGRHVLYVVSDNHLNRDIPTQMYAFAAAAGVTYVPQDLPAPMFPPGQVKKALGLRP